MSTDNFTKKALSWQTSYWYYKWKYSWSFKMALNLFYQSLPNKLDSLEKIQTWHYGGKIKINSYLSDTYLSFCHKSKYPQVYLSRKRGWLSRELLYLQFTQQKLTKQKHLIPSNVKFTSNIKIWSFLKSICFIFSSVEMVLEWKIRLVHKLVH